MKPIDKALVKRSFGQAAQHYNQFTSLQRHIGDSLMKRYSDEMSAYESVLDVGAGTGYLTNHLTEVGANRCVHAVDISFAMLQQTRLNIKGVSHLRLACADADALPFLRGSMDAVYSNLAFQWCADLTTTFSEASAVLKPKGRFVFSTFGPQTLTELKYAWGFADDSVHVNAFSTIEEVTHALRASGFGDITIETEVIELLYQSPNDLMQDLKGMGAHNINNARKRGLTGIKAYKRMLKAYQTLVRPEGLPATFEAIYVYANSNKII